MTVLPAATLNRAVILVMRHRADRHRLWQAPTARRVVARGAVRTGPRRAASLSISSCQFFGLSIGFGHFRVRYVRYEKQKQAGTDRKSSWGRKLMGCARFRETSAKLDYPPPFRPIMRVSPGLCCELWYQKIELRRILTR